MNILDLVPVGWFSADMNVFSNGVLLAELQFSRWREARSFPRAGTTQFTKMVCSAIAFCLRSMDEVTVGQRLRPPGLERFRWTMKVCRTY